MMTIMDSTKAQATAVPRVIDGLCRACPKCVARKVCRTKAIVRIDQDEAPFIDPSRCYGCQVCVTECPFGAIVAAGK
jgi:MinD superfamily P-loop ATPase